MTAHHPASGHAIRLPNGRTASYEWGSYAIWLSDPLAVDKDTVGLMLAAIANGNAYWRDSREFRRFVAILHEATHCLQDLTTGVGLFDYFCRRERFPEILSEVRNASWNSRLGDRFGREAPSDAYGRWLDAGFLPQSPDARARRLRHVEQRLKADPRIDVRGLDLESLAIDRLLEADAVVQVYLALDNLAMAPTEKTLKYRNRAMWAVSDMPEAYQGVYHEVLDVVRRWKEADGGTVDDVSTILALRLSALLMDLSLAHPSGQLIGQQQLDPNDYEPGLKFVVLLSALYRLELEQHREFMTALESWDIATAEGVLLRNSSIAYLPTSVIYTDWMARLEDSLRAGEDEITRLRYRVLQHRINNPASFVFKSLLTFFGYPMPLILVDRKGYRSSTTDPYYLDSTIFDLIAAIQHDVSVRRLVYCAYEAIPFVCCHAEFATCAGRLRSCKAGIVREEEFPGEENCEIKRWLKHSYFGFFRVRPLS